MVQKTELKDGFPCDHPGCANHFSHPCEGCGRINMLTKRNYMTKTEAMDFLKELVKEIDSQDNRCTADPYYYTIQTKEWRPVPDGCSGPHGESREIWVENGDNSTFDSKEELIKQLKENSDEDITDKEIENIIEEDYTQYTEGAFDKYENFFLTEKACEKHIKLNAYHYNEPHSYVDHTWRNPEIENLIKAIRALVKEK